MWADGRNTAEVREHLLPRLGCDLNAHSPISGGPRAVEGITDRSEGYVVGGVTVERHAQESLHQGLGGLLSPALGLCPYLWERTAVVVAHVSAEDSWAFTRFASAGYPCFTSPELGRLA